MGKTFVKTVFGVCRKLWKNTFFTQLLCAVFCREDKSNTYTSSAHTLIHTPKLGYSILRTLGFYTISTAPTITTIYLKNYKAKTVAVN